MSVLKPRSRLVYFRCSGDEFRQIQHLCESTGARSISEVARAAVQRLISDTTPAQPSRLLEDQQALDRVVGELRQAVTELRGIIFAASAEPVGHKARESGAS